MSLVAIPEAGLMVVVLVIAAIGIKVRPGDFSSRGSSPVAPAALSENAFSPADKRPTESLSKQFQTSEKP